GVVGQLGLAHHVGVPLGEVLAFARDRLRCCFGPGHHASLNSLESGRMGVAIGVCPPLSSSIGIIEDSEKPWSFRAGMNRNARNATGRVSGAESLGHPTPIVVL